MTAVFVGRLTLHARGRPRSRAWDDVLREAEALLQQGVALAGATAAGDAEGAAAKGTGSEPQAASRIDRPTTRRPRIAWFSFTQAPSFLPTSRQDA